MKTRTAVICRKDNRVLYVRKPKPKWALQGGKIEPGETPAKAAVRELEEETGLVAENLTYLARFEDNTTHFVFITLLQPGASPRPQNEIAACKWNSRKRFRKIESSPATKAIVKTFADFQPSQ